MSGWTITGSSARNLINNLITYKPYLLKTQNLCNVDLTGHLDFLFDDLGELDGEDTVLDLGGDILLLHIVGQNQGLLKL